MNRVDQLQLQLRALAARVSGLESARAAASTRPKETIIPAPKAPRPRYATIPQARSDARHNLWTEYFFLKQAEVVGQFYNRKRGQHPPTSKTWFAETVRINGERLSTREFARWFQRTNTHPEGSAQDRKIRAAIQGEIARLRAGGYTIGGRVSRGTA
jgi:hypothetical protein